MPVGSFTLDFFAPSIDLAIEVDGELHDPLLDARRDAWLAERGIEVMRIPSLDLFEATVRKAHVQAVWNRVHQKLAERHPADPAQR